MGTLPALPSGPAGCTRRSDEDTSKQQTFPAAALCQAHAEELAVGDGTRTAQVARSTRRKAQGPVEVLRTWCSSFTGRWER